MEIQVNKEYKCVHCNKGFLLNHNLTRHIKNVHGFSPEEKNSSGLNALLLFHEKITIQPISKRYILNSRPLSNNNNLNRQPLDNNNNLNRQPLYNNNRSFPSLIKERRIMMMQT
jgi:hypothetical protein